MLQRRKVKKQMIIYKITIKSIKHKVFELVDQIGFASWESSNLSGYLDAEHQEVKGKFVTFMQDSNGQTKDLK